MAALESRLTRVIIHAPVMPDAMPNQISGLAPTLPTSRPTISMLIRLPMPRGIIATPVSSVGY
jgi:hypothetical protein